MTRLTVCNYLGRAGLWLALLGAAGCTLAHEWTSPSATVQPPAKQRMQERAGWRGMLWAGPHAGPPAAPNARDCQRNQQPFELPGPEGVQMRGKTSAGEAHKPLLLSSAPAVARAAAADLTNATTNGTTPAPHAPHAPQDLHDARRQAFAPVTAGVVDDNADFGEYLAYRQRQASHPSRLNVRDRDITERYRLSVNDAAGRPVPDALVSVHAGGLAQALWARTDAAGQVWLHPRAAGLGNELLQVQVSKPSSHGELRGNALLRRGQRDALQVRLDASLPIERARLDLVFLVDATGSMGDEIDKLKRSMRAIAEQVAALPSQPDVCFALVAYRDRGDEFFVRGLDFTNDLAALQRQLDALRAAGGGDYPEALNEALHTAVHRLSWRGDGATRMVLLVADAPPHLDYGSPWYDDDMQGALARGIKLFTLGASGLDASGEYIYRQMAQFTGGRFVFLTYDKATQPSSGPGRETVHDVANYSVETLDKLVVRLVRDELARRPS